jgi:hypothetical protein
MNTIMEQASRGPHNGQKVKRDCPTCPIHCRTLSSRHDAVKSLAV